MGPTKCDYNKQLVTLSVITWSGFHCIKTYKGWVIRSNIRIFFLFAPSLQTDAEIKILVPVNNLKFAKKNCVENS